MRATRIFTNGRIYPLGERDECVEALAVDGDRICALGTNADIERLAHEDTDIVDLQGRAVFPGFIDAHTHWEVAAHIRKLWIDATLEPLERILEIVREEVARRPEGDWIVIAGGFLSPLPSRVELDEIAPEHPVVVRRTMHVQAANSLAFAASGLSAADPYPMPACRLEVGEDGELTGLIEDGFDLFAIPVTPAETLEPAMVEVARESFLANGITTIHDMPASRSGTRSLQRMRKRGEMPLRVVLYPILPPVHRSGPGLEVYEDVALETGLGDDWLRFGGVKLFVDGHERAAAYNADMAAGVDRHRLPLFGRTYEELVATVVRCMRAGIQLRMHAWGDYAQRQAVDAVASGAVATGTSDHRTRVEHMLNAKFTSVPLEEIRDTGIVPVPQACFLVNDDPSAERTKYPFREAIDAGLRFANSSDCTGSQPTLISPWVGIATMLTRTNRNGEVIDADEAVTLTEALKSYTSGSAYAAFEEGDKGSLEPGKFADLVIVDDDPYSLEPHAIAELDAAMTVIGGEIVYRRTAG